jgi:hypothetical protein
MTEYQEITFEVANSGINSQGVNVGLNVSLEFRADRGDWLPAQSVPGRPGVYEFTVSTNRLVYINSYKNIHKNTQTQKDI